MLRCNIKKPEKCKDTVFDRIRVRVKHEDTGNVTKQQWYVCKVHFIMINNNPKRFYSFYNHKEANANVLEVVETGLIGD